MSRCSTPPHRADHVGSSPRYGFSPYVGNAPARDQQADKLRLIVETADEVWG